MHQSIKEIFLSFFQISSGLSYLSSKDIYHLDIAARNILLQDPNKSAFIADFGLSMFGNDKRIGKGRR